jgi:hypothetical protein
MLDHIDKMRQLFITQVPGIASPLQVRFQPPDDDWRTYVSTLGKVALNIYLVELKENWQLRSCGVTRKINQGVAIDTPLPRYIDVTYLITAWGPANAGPAIKPTTVEHELLRGVIVALANADPLHPIRIFFPQPLPIRSPALTADAELPTVFLPQEGFGKHAEFWGTIPGANHPWRPAVLLIVTLPVTAADCSGTARNHAHHGIQNIDKHWRGRNVGRDRCHRVRCTSASAGRSAGRVGIADAGGAQLSVTTTDRPGAVSGAGQEKLR